VTRRCAPQRWAEACGLVSTLAGAWSCGEKIDCIGECAIGCYDRMTVEGVVPVPFDELAAGSITWCAGQGCLSARVASPLSPSPQRPDWYALTTGGSARPVEPDSTELSLWGPVYGQSDHDVLTLTVNDPDGGVLFEHEQSIDFVDSGYCRYADVTITQGSR
jgi:hypothetical protein